MNDLAFSSATEQIRPARISEEEWRLRVKLAATYRIFDYMGWTLIVFNHITVRVPGPEHHFLINRFGLRYDEVTASNLVKIDLDGNVLDTDGDAAFNYAGFIIHGAIHANVPEALWIMHTHTKEGVAVSCKAHGLRNTNFYSAMLYEHVAYHDFEGLTLREDEQQRLVASIGNKPIVILRNHGLLVHGRTAEEAFSRMWNLQLACETQMLTESMAGETVQVSREASEMSARDSRLFSTDDGQVGLEAFAALERIIDARDLSYRT